MELPQSLSHAYLITGGSEDSRKDLARRMASAYLCTGHPVPCGVCRHCRKVAGDIHPDVQWVTPEADKREISVDQARALRADLYVTPNEGARKVYIISPADALNPEAQNALLKSLEDGPAYGAFLLLAEQPGRLLETVRSRCETLALPPQDHQPDPRLLDKAQGLARLLLTGSELEVARGLTALELEKSKSAQLLELLSLTEGCVAGQLTAHPARGAKVLQILKQCRENGVYNPGVGHVLGWVCARLFG